MKNNELENVIPDYFNRIIRNSWTWERLTNEERERFTAVNFDHITGSKKQRIESLNAAYSAFLYALGYKPVGWRENSLELMPF